MSNPSTRSACNVALRIKMNLIQSENESKLFGCNIITQNNMSRYDSIQSKIALDFFRILKSKLI